MDVILFLLIVSCLILAWAYGRGQLPAWPAAAQRRGLVVDDYVQAARHHPASIWFWADRETARRFGRYGRLYCVDENEAGDLYWQLIISHHVNGTAVLQAMRIGQPTTYGTRKSIQRIS